MMLQKACKEAILVALLMAFAVVLAAPAVMAQDAAEPAEQNNEKKLSELWDDMLHYIKIARADLAAVYGQSILAAGAEPRELYRLSVETPGWQSVLTKGARQEALKEIIANIYKIIEKGYEQERKDPEQIANAIKMLDGTLRGKKLAAERLVISGEYALPQLVQKLRDPQSSDSLRASILTVFDKLGKEAVRPLSVALQTDEPKLQQMLAGALGEISYPSAAPRLKELLNRKDLLDNVRRTAQAALIVCEGRSALEKSAAELFYNLAERYYYQGESVAPDLRYDEANVWYWQEDLGLTYKPVPREIFCDIYAMRMAQLTLKHDPKFYKAVSLWLAAFIKKEADLPEGKSDPTQGQDAPRADYYAMAGSARYLQDVLVRALKDKNSAVAVGAIEALAKTCGAKSLVTPVAGGAQPLVAALTYPERKVRFLAAVTLANAGPERRFEGDDLVLRVLNEALRQTGQKRALVITPDQEELNILTDAVRAAGYEVLNGADAVEVLAAGQASSGIEAVV
ncbi:MAG: HEAT repeat domain-containing protein, partial [Phycisphaerae bacterium]|nr:HEAT repeat domain-containing protein [Phycisphaerae bacterium]